MSAYSFRLTEEIARYAFEAAIENSSECFAWKIAYTNPSAGPWKIVKGLNSEGKWGEVHRFLREEERPDLVLFNDTLNLIIIIEAKDSLAKLLEAEQVRKSAAVVRSLSNALREKAEHPFWRQRINYTVVAGFLWGGKKKADEIRQQELFNAYREALGEGTISKVLLGIESCYDKSTDSIKCYGCTSSAGELHAGVSAVDLLKSLPIE